MPAPTTMTTSNSRITTTVIPVINYIGVILAKQLFALPAITPVANGKWDPVTGGGLVGDKVEGAPVHNTVNCNENELLHSLVGGLSFVMSDTFPSKMDCELFQE